MQLARVLFDNVSAKDVLSPDINYTPSAMANDILLNQRLNSGYHGYMSRHSAFIGQWGQPGLLVLTTAAKGPSHRDLIRSGIDMARSAEAQNFDETRASAAKRFSGVAAGIGGGVGALVGYKATDWMLPGCPPGAPKLVLGFTGALIGATGAVPAAKAGAEAAGNVVGDIAELFLGARQVAGVAGKTVKDMIDKAERTGTGTPDTRTDPDPVISTAPPPLPGQQITVPEGPAENRIDALVPHVGMAPAPDAPDPPRAPGTGEAAQDGSPGAPGSPVPEKTGSGKVQTAVLPPGRVPAPGGGETGAGAAPGILSNTALTVTVAAGKSNGQPWDLSLFDPVAALPDIQIRIASANLARTCADRDAPKCPDSLSCGVRLPVGLYLPLSMEVIDRGVGEHDLIGTGECADVASICTIGAATLAFAPWRA